MGSPKERLYNNELWTMDIVLKNPDGDEYPFPANMILELVIEESLLEWPVKGYLVYGNPLDEVERGDFYTYRMDGKDELTISTNIKEEPDGKVPKELWKIKHEFVVYDSEDLPSSSLVTKVKKIWFWDKRYQHMLENNNEWCTATTELNPDYEENMSQKSDKERGLLTGDAIKALLIDGGLEDHIDEENWNDGISDIFYTSASTTTMLDDLRNILNVHHSGDDKCIFFTNREKENKFQLTPVHEFYNKFEDLTYEKMNLEDFGGNKGGSSTKAPDKGDTYGQFSTIYSYEFVDMTGIDNVTNLNTKPVYWYDTGKGQFGVDFKDHDIEKIKDDFKELYCDGKWLRSPLFTLNKTKKEQHNIDPNFTLADVTSNYFGTKQERYQYGKNTILWNAVFLNEGLSIRMPGIPTRTRGTFIGVDRPKGSSSTDNKLDYKLCGPWFVVKVTHLWKHDKYVNDLICSKIGSYESLKISDDK